LFPGPEEDGVEMSDTNYVTGEIAVLEEYIDFPPVHVGDAATNNNNKSIPLTEQGRDPLDDNGVLELGGAGNKKKKRRKKGDDGENVAGADSLNLPPGTYYYTELNLRNNSIIRVSGPTYIYVSGNIDLADGGIVNSTRIPMNLRIYPLGSEFWLPNNVDLYAVIYSTTSAIEKEGGGGGFFGKMVGQKIKINGSGGLHVDDAVIFGELRSGGEQLGTSTGASLVY
jgi:hypothetical protein